MARVAQGPVTLIRNGREPGEHGFTDDHIQAALERSPEPSRRWLARRLVGKRCTTFGRIHGAQYWTPEWLQKLAFPPADQLGPRLSTMGG